MNDERRQKAEREVFNIVHRGGLEPVSLSSIIEKIDLELAGQNWTDEPLTLREIRDDLVALRDQKP